MAQSFYMQVSVWMVRMDSELSYAATKSDPNGFKAEMTSRSSLFIQVPLYLLRHFQYTRNLYALAL